MQLERNADHELFNELERGIQDQPTDDLKLLSVLQMIQVRAERDAEVLSCVCDNQAAL